MRPDFHVLFSGLEDQVNKRLSGGVGWKWRGIGVNAPKPVSSKSMLLKKAMVGELQIEVQLIKTKE